MSDPLPDVPRNRRRNRSKKHRSVIQAVAHNDDGGGAGEDHGGGDDVGDVNDIVSPEVSADQLNGETESDDQPVPVSPSRRKLSRKMIVAYLHEDGTYCPRTINQPCQEHDGEDMNEISEGQTLDLNSVPGFPGVGGFGMSGAAGGGMPFGYGGGAYGGTMGLGGGMMGPDGNMISPDGGMLGFGGGMIGPNGGLDGNMMGPDGSMLGFGGGMMGPDGNMIGSDGSMLGGGMMGLDGNMMGLEGNMGMMGLGGGMLGPGLEGGEGGLGYPGYPGYPGMPGGQGQGVGDMTGIPGLGSVRWPYDQTTQQQLAGMSPDFTGLPGSLSKDSGLDFDGGQPGGDPLAGGLNSMGLGGRGFPAYGNQAGFGGFGGFGGFPGGAAGPFGSGDFSSLGNMPQTESGSGGQGGGGFPPGAPAFFPSLTGNRSGLDLTSALRYQQELMRLRFQRRQQEARKFSLMNAARMLQQRSSQSKSRLSVMMDNNCKKEKVKTEDLEKECKQLRLDIDEQHKIRMEAFEIKMKPIVVNEEPSRKANYKIQGAKIQYDIYALCLRLRDTTFRAEHEEKRRTNIEREVNKLRDKISDLKVQISTITKGVPITKIEVREERRDGRDGRTSVATSHTARSRRSVREEEERLSPGLEDDYSSERREKLVSLMEAEKERQGGDGRSSPLRILQSQQKTAREILLA